MEVARHDDGTHKKLRPTHKTQGNQKIHPAGFEPATFGFVGRRSIQLSYGCPFVSVFCTELSEFRQVGI